MLFKLWSTFSIMSDGIKAGLKAHTAHLLVVDRKTSNEKKAGTNEQ